MRDTGVTQALGVGAPVPGSGHWLARLLALRAQRAGVLRGEEEEGGRGRRGGLRGERMGEARRRGVWNGKAQPAAGAGAGAGGQELLGTGNQCSERRLSPPLACARLSLFPRPRA